MPPFPTAVGYGCEDTSGLEWEFDYENAVEVYVDNANSSGSGSFPQAITDINNSSSPAHILVFRSGGDCDLASAQLILDGKSQVQIAGQTAPGDGFEIRKGMLTIRDCSKTILRFLRIRNGGTGVSHPTPSASLNQDCLQVQSTTGTMASVIVDHCSIYWSQDECLAITRNSGTLRNVTAQYNLVAEPLRAHPDYPRNDAELHDRAFFYNGGVDFCTGWRNLLATFDVRGPHLRGGDNVQWINNGAFNFNTQAVNFQARPEAGSGDMQLDFIGNWFRTGKAAGNNDIVKLFDSDRTEMGTSNIYLAGNTDKDGVTIPSNQQDIIDAISGGQTQMPTFVTSRQFFPTVETSILVATTLKTHLVANCGARWGMQSGTGLREAKVDFHDDRVLAYVDAESQTDPAPSNGRVDEPADVGGFVSHAQGSWPPGVTTLVQLAELIGFTGTNGEKRKAILEYYANEANPPTPEVKGREISIFAMV